MASGSRSRGQGNAVAGADALALDTLANPDLAHLPAVDLVVYLHRDDRRGSDFADVALVLADRERRLTEAEDRIRKAKLNAAGLRDTICELEEKVANAEALVRDRTVAGEDDDESQAGDHLTAIDDVGGAELTGGEIRAQGLEIVVRELGAGEITPGLCLEAGVEATPDEVRDNIPSPIPLMTIHAFPPVSVTAAPALPGELIEDRAIEGVVVNVAVPRSHKVAEAGVADCWGKVSEAITHKMKRPSSDLPLPLDDLRRSSLPCEVVDSDLPYPHDHLRRSSLPCKVVDSHLPYPHDHLDVDNMPSPIPLMTNEAFSVPITAAPVLSDELIEAERAVEQLVVDVAVPRSTKVAEAGVVDCRNKVSEAIARKRKEPAYDISLILLDNHRVTGHKVSEEEEHGEDVAESPHRGSQGKQPATATKKARRQKETSFYSMVLKALMEKQNLLQKKEKEAIAMKAAAAACKQLHCRCWWSDAPCSP